MKKKQLFLPLILITAFSIRLWTIFLYGDFWYDEMFNFIYSQKNWSDSFWIWLWETNPPLHLLILKIWFFIFPANELWARIPSLLAGVLSVFFIYKLGKSLFGKSIALISALYLALHSYVIFWSATARVYSFLILLSITSIFYFWKIFFIGKKTKKYKFLFILSHTLLLFSHLTSVFLVVSEFIILIIFKKKKIKKWIILNIAPILLGGTWIAYSFYIKSTNQLEKSWFLNIKHTWQSALQPLINIITGTINIWSGLFLVIAVIFLLSATIYKEKNNPSRKFLIIILLSILPLIFSAVLGVWHIKFFLISLPFLILAISYSLKQFFNLTISCLIIILFSIPSLWSLYKIMPISDWDSVKEKIILNETNDENSLILYNNFIIKSQIDKYLNKLDIPKLAFNLAQKDMSWDELVVKRNYIFINYNTKEIKEWYSKNDLNKYNKIYLIQGEYTYMTKLNKILKKENWKLESWPEKLKLSGNYWLYIYKK